MSNRKAWQSPAPKQSGPGISERVPTAHRMPCFKRGCVLAMPRRLCGPRGKHTPDVSRPCWTC